MWKQKKAFEGPKGSDRKIGKLCGGRAFFSRVRSREF